MAYQKVPLDKGLESCFDALILSILQSLNLNAFRDTLKLMTSLQNLRLNVRKGELNAWSDAIRGGWWRQLIKDFEDEKLKFVSLPAQVNSKSTPQYITVLISCAIGIWSGNVHACRFSMT